jgi:formiminotetrahydrofolate cyclodeaminase
VLKFEKFLKDNEAKRQRANLKAISEKKLREAKEQELEQLKKQLKEEHGKHERILKNIGTIDLLI